MNDLDIEIPVIEIEPGWSVSDLHTIEDCDDANAILIAAVAGIEMQIELASFKPLNLQDPEWTARAKGALRFKKAALGIVMNRRGAINRAEELKRLDRENEQLLAFVREALPPGEWFKLVTAFNAGRREPMAKRA